MADHQITPGQRGAYEIPVPADTSTTVAVTGRPPIAQVIHHSGDSPIYVSVNQAAQPGDPASRMVTQGAWLDIALDVARDNTIHVTSRSDAIVSVTLP